MPPIMQMRFFFAAAMLVALLGFVGFRIFDLEQRVDALARQMAGARGTAGEARQTQGGAANQGYEQRLVALEKRMDGMKANMHTIEKATGLGIELPGPHADKQILSVLERENNRVRDVQLEWSRSRWHDTRQEQLTLFAQQNNLSSSQSAELQKTLEHEVDAMVEVLRRPNLIDDPDTASNDWQALLDETDRAAQRVLSPAQLTAWSQARTFERKVLWPWLPPSTAMNK
jgi:hypothetical protein